MLTQVVDYKYYSETYGGSSIPESSFVNYEIKARNKVNYYTSNRITEDILDENIKNTICEIAEFIYSQDTLKNSLYSEDKVKASETVGPHSVTYVNKDNILEKRVLKTYELDKECYKICYQNLIHTGLMYRGIN